jgi:hypothetical protein
MGRISAGQGSPVIEHGVPTDSSTESALMTYEQIAAKLGYANRGTVYHVVSGVGAANPNR